MAGTNQAGNDAWSATEERNSQASSGAQGFAAIFIDYENVYYHLKSAYADIPELNDFVIDLLMSLQQRLEENNHVRSIITNAYADFERLRSTPQGSLYLMGVDTVNVLGTEHKNAADMKLCIDAMEVLYSRSEIRTFVIFAGDRDYIPLIQHLKKQAKTVVCVGFEGSFSGDLMQIVGRQNFIDAHELFAKDRLAKLQEMSKKYKDYQEAEQEREEQRNRELQEKRLKTPEAALMPIESTSAGKVSAAPGGMRENSAAPPYPESSDNVIQIDSVLHHETPVPSQSWNDSPAPAGEPEKENSDRSSRKAIAVAKSQAGAPDAGTPDAGTPDAGTHNYPIAELNENERLCLELILRIYGNYHDIYLSPFLRKLSDALPNFADWQRKALLNDLEFKGAMKLEKRTGIQNDYTVIVLNYNHPAVRDLC